MLLLVQILSWTKDVINFPDDISLASSGSRAVTGEVSKIIRKKFSKIGKEVSKYTILSKFPIFWSVGVGIGEGEFSR